MSRCDWCEDWETDNFDPITGTLMCERCTTDLAAGLEAEFVDIEKGLWT